MRKIINYINNILNARSLNNNIITNISNITQFKIIEIKLNRKISLSPIPQYRDNYNPQNNNIYLGIYNYFINKSPLSLYKEKVALH